MKIGIEDIVFWILILLIIGLAFWMLHGSPTEISAIIALAIFVAGSEIIIWKTIFKNDKNSSVAFVKLDKKTSISFEKVKSRFDKIDNQLNDIKLLIKNKK